jgi:hypothetical protein
VEVASKTLVFLFLKVDLPFAKGKKGCRKRSTLSCLSTSFVIAERLARK